jgi:hypothetical protein
MNHNIYHPPSASLTHRGAPGGGRISPAVIERLCETQPWAGLTGILGLITTVFNVGLGIYSASAIYESTTTTAPYALAGYIVGFAVFGLLALYPLIRLCLYASAINRLRTSKSAEDFEKALRQQWLFWRFVGVLSVTVICVFAFVILTSALRPSRL